MMIDVDTVVDSFSLKPQQFKLEKTDTTKMKSLVEEYISQAEDLIKQYTNNKFANEIPPSVQNVCLRIVSNIITFVTQRRDTPIIKVNDWTVTTVNSEIFTDAEKNDLEPFVIEHSSRSDKIDIFAITGADD